MTHSAMQLSGPWIYKWSCRIQRDLKQSEAALGPVAQSRATNATKDNYHPWGRSARFHPIYSRQGSTRECEGRALFRHSKWNFRRLGFQFPGSSAWRLWTWGWISCKLGIIYLNFSLLLLEAFGISVPLYTKVLMQLAGTDRWALCQFLYD